MKADRNKRMHNLLGLKLSDKEIEDRKKLQKDCNHKNVIVFSVSKVKSNKGICKDCLKDVEQKWV